MWDMCSEGFAQKTGMPVAVKKDPGVYYVSSRAAVVACGELPPVVFCDSWLNTLNGREKNPKG